jgi:hypothetical protein
MNATALTTAIAGIRRKVIVCRIPRQHRQLSNLVDGMASATGVDDIMVGVCAIRSKTFDERYPQRSIKSDALVA